MNYPSDVIAVLLRTVILVACSLTLSAVAEAAGEQASASTTTSAGPSVANAVSARAQDARPWQYIVVHHSATTAGSVESIDRVHKQRRDSQGNPWRGIGYHFVIGNGDGMVDGEVQATFRWVKQIEGAHAGSKEHNELGVGICLIGNFENHAPTEKQTAALSALIDALQSRHTIAGDHVLAHGDVKATRCPGRLFPRDKFLTAQTVHTVRRPVVTNTSTSDALTDPSEHTEPSCETVLQIAEPSSNWKESR